MGRSTLRIITILGVICITGIAVVQMYWFRKAFDQEEKQFSDRTRIALNRVANQLLDQTSDSTAQLESIRQLSSNYFTVEFNTAINPESLEEALFNEFHNQKIGVNFEYGIFACDNDSIIHGSKVDLNEYTSVQQINYQPQANENFYFGVLFPSKTSYIADQLRIWLVFTVLLFMVILFFSYALFVIFKQKKLSEIKTDFINNMTHELKTPLSTISASSEVLMKSNNNSPERVSTYAAIINQESKRLKQQIESVLKISVLDSNKLTLKKEVFDLGSLLNTVVQTYMPLVKAQSGELKCDISKEKVDFKGDKIHIENVLHNLMENALKYSNDRLSINVVLYYEKNKAIIKVSDKGEGIEEHMQRKIFDKFFRVPTGDVHNVKGFGLGLYYVKKIVQAHNGIILVDSKLNKGTTFIIKLPVNN
ncbi:MAG: HAMP domain-containing histidine kinase [Bacteroidetes bacterium]|nr:HAMP domain-containing histidine kinase [Bacteroidota bacterium]